MRKYEAIFIFATSQEEEKRTQLLDRLKKIIETDGTISNVDDWGVRKLAYPINDIGEGHYVLLNFETSIDSINELDRIAKISDNIMRHIIIREDE